MEHRITVKDTASDEFYTYTYAGVDQMNGRALYNANSQLGESTINALKAQDEYVTINGKN